MKPTKEIDTYNNIIKWWVEDVRNEVYNEKRVIHGTPYIIINGVLQYNTDPEMPTRKTDHEPPQSNIF